MRSFDLGMRYILLFVAMLASLVGLYETLHADSSKYPQFAQQALPDPAPSFIRLDDLVEQIKAGKKPLIIDVRTDEEYDVRTDEEYREAHILGSVSAPLSEFEAYIPSIPKDRLVVLY